MIKRILVAIGILVILGFVTMWMLTAPYRELNAWNADVISRLESTKFQPPSDVAREQWETIVGWTQIAFPNVFFTPDYITDNLKFECFQTELDQRLDGSVDLKTIAWIWDEFGVHGKNGTEYAGKFRPVAPYGEIHLDESGNPYENVDVDFRSGTIADTDEQ